MDDLFGNDDLESLSPKQEWIAQMKRFGVTTCEAADQDGRDGQWIAQIGAVADTEFNAINELASKTSNETYDEWRTRNEK